MTTATITNEKIKVDLNVKPPVNYNVIYMNDDVTTTDFVIESLVLVFNFSESAANEVTQKIHTEGSAIVATLSYEVAEQKGVEVTMLARSAGFPLMVRLDPVA